MNRKIQVAALAVATLLLLSGCTEVAEESSTTSSTAPAVSSSAGDSQVPAQMQQYNMLTGNYDIPKGSATRLIGVMIGNNDKSRPQYGIEQADMYIEGETEGGITRIMAVFSSVDHVPEMLGPVRSARSPFVTLAQALDVVYCHAGGSITALARLKEIDIATINGLLYDGTTYWRDEQLAKEKGYEYSMMTNATLLSERIGELGYRTQTDHSAPFTFGNVRGTASGRRVQVDISSYQTIYFTYDDAADVYTKYNGTFEDGEKHVTANGTPITASNVVILYAPKYMENELTCDFDLSEGRGIVLSGGTSRYLQYTCSADGLQLSEEDGTPLQMAQGKTYLCFVNTALAGDTILE